jgi:arylsulfatase A-like enzyme
MFPRAINLCFVFLAILCSTCYSAKPNVVLIITDDQGYGDIAAHGNQVINTPNIDELFRRSVRLTNFHVDPTCSPTRSALMSGRYSTKTGVWHTICGRSIMDRDELTLAEIFKANGYHTGMFGKWHLGDAAPCRPQDQGFDRVVCHGGGGVGQTPDYWGNDYFDDTYWRDGNPVKFNGYCTDVWFEEASKFIDKNRSEPFFVYLSTNAPHGPYLVAPKYSKPYEKVGSPADKFLGMITNIDENIGNLVAKLRRDGLEENTVFIFMTDNGTAAGANVFNAGMRGSKGSEYEGGHRVPFYVYWPAGNLTGGRDVKQLTAHIDVRPTLVDLCELKEPEGPTSDGSSLVSALHGDEDCLRDRTLFVHSQRILDPKKWRKCSVMTERWRLVNGEELFDISTDPGQRMNVAADHADKVAELRAAYDGWWESLKPAMARTVYVQIGSDAEPRTRLTGHDWLIDGSTPWNQRMIRAGQPTNGPWAVEVAKDGKYEIVVSRWPEFTKLPMDATNVRLSIQDQEQSKKVASTDTTARFEIDLKQGQTMLQTYLDSKDGKKRGAYFAYVRRL